MTQPKIEGTGHGMPRMLYASDGSNWYAILVDSDGHVKTDVKSRAKKRTCYTGYDTVIAAGGSLTVLAATNGRGRVYYSTLRVDGASEKAKHSCIKLTVDGSLETEITLDYLHFGTAFRVTDQTDFGIVTWDDNNRIYCGWAHELPDFDTSLKIEIVNDDPANAITVRYAIFVDWES